MAIFRAGKRIGPFDIRMGFPRDKSMDNIDGDVRLRQHANTENTIGRFRAMMARSEGYARPARFAVHIFPPANLKKMAADSTVTTKTLTKREGTIETQTTTPGHPDAIAMQQLFTQMGEQVNINCDSVVMPGHDLQTETIDHFGPTRDMVVGHAYAGTIKASFYADKYLRERHFLEMWQKLAVNNLTHRTNYYDDYVGKMQIFQLGSWDGAGDRDVPTYAIEATEVYPEQIGSINYNYASKNQLVRIDVEFQYRQWFNMTTDGIGDVEYTTRSQQTMHEVKSRKGGWFDRLPPELKRAGRSVINQAKTQLPIGRLTKGKIFPPFT